MHRFTASLRTSARSDAGASMVETSFQLLAAFVLVGLAFLAFNRILGGSGPAPLEQCIEHQGCTAAVQAHGS